jgi:acyl dehydratase
MRDLAGTRREKRDLMPTSSEIAALTFDQLKPGDRFPLGDQEITRSEVIAFASKYDPQPYHLDDAAAAANPVFGRLSASGWHITVTMTLLLDRFWRSTRVRGLAGAGADEIRWLEPVYPGDVLSGTVEIVAARKSASRPDRGVMTMQVTLQNQHQRPVANMKVTGVFARNG